MTITELRKKRASVWESAKAFLNSHRQENGLLSSEDDATYSKMEKEITDLGAEIARLERQEAIEAELSKPVNQPITGQPMRTDDQESPRLRATKAYREDFLNHIRGNKLVNNVLSTTPGSDGGYLVPDEFERQIITALEEENVFRKIAKVIKTEHDRKIPVAGEHSVAQWTDENGEGQSRTIDNTNGYLRGDVEAPSGVTVIGGKTGTTNAAGHCLILLAKDGNGNPYIAVILRDTDGDTLYSDMTNMLNEIVK